MSAVMFPRPLTQQEVEAVRSGAKAMFIYGEVRYHDETHNERRFRWCSYYMTDKPTALGMLPSCRFHNSSD